ncbi:hypothetical protein MLD38_024879 [Melastoma candidum]|uniref:Uncharacterized protein n=1 Tax=Melastoma candidum TaxID=119954 RepID=A0ACB9NUL3_9MYRT|nr:hypothetical protein MLD38_024879 [Melastoma candidum]
MERELVRRRWGKTALGLIVAGVEEVTRSALSRVKKGDQRRWESISDMPVLRLLGLDVGPLHDRSTKPSLFVDSRRAHEEIDEASRITVEMLYDYVCCLEQVAFSQRSLNSGLMAHGGSKAFKDHRSRH